ncbi:MAG: helix-turn-helix transcriptional regulator [Cyclobacteriaceae bacterium]|nr:helix-turn-helix transcriptional regulator [Cyclobacteriaceae bacterium]
MASQVFEHALNKVSKDSKIFAEKSLDILDQINFLMREEGWTQKDLSKKLGKSESEISKWLSGLHNMTLKTVSKLEAVFNRDILITPIKAKQRYSSIKFVPVKTVVFKSVAHFEEKRLDREFTYNKAS